MSGELAGHTGVPGGVPTCVVNNSAPPRSILSPNTDGDVSFLIRGCATNSKPSRKREREVSLEPTPTENDANPFRERKYSSLPLKKKRCVLVHTALPTGGSSSRSASVSPLETRGDDSVLTLPRRKKKWKVRQGIEDNSWKGRTEPSISEKGVEIAESSSADVIGPSSQFVPDGKTSRHEKVDKEETVPKTPEGLGLSYSIPHLKGIRSDTNMQLSPEKTTTADDAGRLRLFPESNDKHLEMEFFRRGTSQGSPEENDRTVQQTVVRQRDDLDRDDNLRETKRPSPSSRLSKGFEPSGSMAYTSTTSPFASFKDQNIFLDKLSPSTFATGSTQLSTGLVPAFHSSTLSSLPVKRSGFEAYSSSPTPFASFPRAKSPQGPTDSISLLHSASQRGQSVAILKDLNEATILGGNFTSTGPVTIYNMPPGPDIGSSLGDDIPNGTNNSHPAGVFDVESDIRCYQKADYDVYYHQLLGKGRGTPLWQPGPSMALPKEYRRRGIGIGDVGILYRSGDFNFLFNILLPAGHEINQGRVPDGFHPLERSKVENGVNRHFSYGSGSCLASSSVRRSSLNDVNSSNFVFETTDREGAILIMPDGALSEDLRSHNLVEKYIAANARGWYEYVKGDDCGRKIENGDIRVVVGIDKVSSWGIATFSSNIEEAVRFEFRGVNDRQAPHKYMWDCVGSGSGRVGPHEEEIRDLILEEPHAPPLRNQSVFVRTMNFTLSGIVRTKLAVHEIRSNDIKTSDLPPTKQGASHKVDESKLKTGGVTFHHSDFGPTVSHPSKFLNNCLLEKFPNAEMAITRDSDWMSVVSEDAAMPGAEELCALVLASHDIICEDEGVITLKRRDPDSTSEGNFSRNTIYTSLASTSSPGISLSKEPFTSGLSEISMTSSRSSLQRRQPFHSYSSTPTLAVLDSSTLVGSPVDTLVCSAGSPSGSTRGSSDNNLDPRIDAKKCVYKILIESNSKDTAFAKVIEMKSKLLQSVFDDASQRKIKSSQRAQDRRTRPPTFCCILCQSLFTTNIALQNHYRSHLRMDQYRCSRCGDYFRTEGIRKRHTENALKCRRLDESSPIQLNSRNLDTSDPDEGKRTPFSSEQFPIHVSESVDRPERP